MRIWYEVFTFFLYTVVIEVKVGGIERVRIDFTDLDFTMVIYPSDAGGAQQYPCPPMIACLSIRSN
jgi:hypothetical protein